jgi:hypothetical protein
MFFTNSIRKVGVAFVGDVVNISPRQEIGINMRENALGLGVTLGVVARSSSNLTIGVTAMASKLRFREFKDEKHAGA